MKIACFIYFAKYFYIYSLTLREYSSSQIPLIPVNPVLQQRTVAELQQFCWSKKSVKLLNNVRASNLSADFPTID